MKIFGAKIISVLLVFSLLFTGVASSVTASAADIGKTLENVGLGIVEVIFTTLVGGLNAIVPDSKDFVKVSERNTDNFYSGTETWDETADADAKWYLGHAKASLIPDDLRESVENGTKSGYYLGGFIDPNNGMSNEIEEIIDDMQVRVIAVKDGANKNVSVFANIDCIGFSNGDIKEIRAALVKLMPDVKFDTINVSCTHTHSCIDTQGLWTNLFAKLFKVGPAAKQAVNFPIIGCVVAVV